MATTDFELRGCPIRAGEAVADHPGGQPAIAGAEQFGPRRTNNPHVAFGRGPHACSGVSLARAELGIALEALLARFPRLSLPVDEDRLRWEEESPSEVTAGASAVLVVVAGASQPTKAQPDG